MRPRLCERCNKVGREYAIQAEIHLDLRRLRNRAASQRGRSSVRQAGRIRDRGAHGYFPTASKSRSSITGRSEYSPVAMILLGLGANLPSSAGPPVATLEAALAELEASGARVVARSRWFRTAPVPPSDQA